MNTPGCVFKYEDTMGNMHEGDCGGDSMFLLNAEYAGALAAMPNIGPDAIRLVLQCDTNVSQRLFIL